MNQQTLLSGRRLNFPETPPKVSILIRTTGRPSLAAAIDSVRSQRFTDWEIVVLEAGGQPVESLPRLLSGVRGRVLAHPAPVPRAQAANALLESAQGSLAVFLDDDDWFMPGHLGKLAAVLDDQPELAAAYSDVVCVTGAGTEAQRPVHTFSTDFDRDALQLQNYLPIHSVMFRVGPVRSDPLCRFDPALDLFEDWDFWLKVAAKGPFRRVAGVTAVYALEAHQGSGHTLQSPHRQAMLAALAARQLRRWQPEDVARLMQRDAQRNDLLNAASQQAEAARQDAEELRAGLQDAFREAAEQGGALQAQIAQGHATIAEIHGSTSWKLTRPVRLAGRLARRLRQALVPRARLARALAGTFRVQLRRYGPVGLARRVPYFLRHRAAYFARLAAQPGAGGNPFSAGPAAVRDVPLHPDIEGPVAPIDAHVTVIIPTLNAGPEFAWLLRKIGAQSGVGIIDLVVVDSGSTDGTVQLARAANAAVIEILPAEFSHSHARNLGASAARGDYLLFMVQDAFPIGEHWVHAMLCALRDPAHPKLVAVSCSEYSRSDSDLMYDSMIDTHYRFLGCRDGDRIGRHRGDDHMSLRSQGQLSDVSCLISRERFVEYRYRGDYAEDLDLGIRLIKDGWEVAMLASVKAIHSHNRPAYYYLKRSFVDVKFLVALFDDFTYPRCASLCGLVRGIASAAAHLSGWLAQMQGGTAPRAGELARCLERWRGDLQSLRSPQAVDLRDARLEAYIDRLAQRHVPAAGATPAESAEARRFAESFVSRLTNLVQFTTQVYDPQEPVPGPELAAAACKTFAAAAGSALAFYCLDQRRPEAAGQAHARAIHDELAAGV